MIGFRYWLENEEIDPEVQKSIQVFQKQVQARQIKQQGGMGKFIHKQQGVWLLPFSAAKQDPEEGWYIDWAEEPGSVSDLDDISIGDKVADYSLNMTPYWVIGGVDKQKNRIYLTPVEPNPFLTGKGAGGATIGQHDIEVHSGEYERQRTNQILNMWQSGGIDSIQDVAYLLLGTVPVRMGPNGAEGGWYSSRDARNNRGGQQGMDSKDIMKKDAKTLKDQFGFAVPMRALSGELDPHTWDQFVGGSTDSREARETRIEGENFDDPNVMLKMILEHPQPQIKMRNWEALDDNFRGWSRYRKEWKEKDYSDEVTKKWQAGEFSNNRMLSYLKKAAIGLAHLSTEQKGKYKFKDPFWLVKEKAIGFASQQGWEDVIEMFEEAPDQDNRRYVFYHYRGDHFGRKQEPQLDKLWEMLDREEHPHNLYEFLTFLYKQDAGRVEQWVGQNRETVDKAIEDPSYGEQLGKSVAYIDQWSKLRREHPGLEGGGGPY
jgi:hypothetical protein